MKNSIIIFDSSNPPRTYVSFICPACDSEVSPKEIIERKGRIGCINCLK